MKEDRGFTLIELLIVITIIGLLAGVILSSLNVSRQKGRDASRATQTNEFFKALELYYAENGVYPDDGVVGLGASIALDDASVVATALKNSDYIRLIPPDPHFDTANGYRYCSNDNLNSMVILINTENDRGGTNYCASGRGPQAYSNTMCTVGGLSVDMLDRCSTRF